MGSVRVIDAAPCNPAFAGDLKQMTKKERLFHRIYGEEVVPFLLKFCELGRDQEHLFRPESIGPVILRFSEEICEDVIGECVKFRVALPKGGKSGGARVSAMIVRTENMVIPLEVYTHSQRGSGADTLNSELRKLFYAVWNGLYEEEACPFSAT